MKSSQIAFTNQPVLSTKAVDSAFNERRMQLVPQLESFISKHALFQDKQVTVTFATKGVSSLVSILEVEDKKLVLKIPLSKKFAEGEALFLKTWQSADVSVPNILEEGSIGEFPYVLMNFINAETLFDTYTETEMLEKKIFVEMGRVLRKMHVPAGPGYGRIINKAVEFSTFGDWLRGADIQDRITYVREHKLLGEEHGLNDELIQKLIDFAGHENKSSFCHGDFGTSNVFATDPITVFDPNPIYSHRYFDIAMSVLLTIAGGLSSEAKAQWIEGYFENEQFDEEIFKKFLVLIACIKFPYWHKKGKVEEMERVRKSLA